MKTEELGIMKAKKLIMALISLAVSAVLAVSAGAYITTVSSSSSYLESSEDDWALVFPKESNAPVEGMSKVEVVVSIAGGQDKYDKEKSSGYYDDGKKTPFADFEGHIGIGAVIDGTDNKYWHSFNYHSLSETNGGSTQAAVKSLGGGKYRFTGTFGSIKVHPSPDSDIQIRFKDWGNKSPNYSLTVEELSVYGPDGTVVIHSDGSGNVKMSFGAAQTTAETTTEATTTTTVATTTEATTTTSEETTTSETSAEETSETDASASETSETTTTAAATTTTKAEETTIAADTEAQTSAEQTAETTAATTKSVKKTTNSSFNDRDTVLLIVGIAAGAIILAVILFLLIMKLKKKK